MSGKHWAPHILKRLNEQWLVVEAPWDMPAGSHELDRSTPVIEGQAYKVIGGEVDARPLAKGERIQIRVERVDNAG
ncbi:hypothetical protein [Methylobacterium oxalidis]|uniref:Uncharacterized protein n=1 Tax=Methylobacterium oxalidis TaxID=944322 RepID=A0A512JDU0_9HYPH|nr:hypothetical protein [Methylobacterium oxalidis]GEP08112.1 hypothetical protein MOX02_61500 [Methylobacterium oxalidis]GJE35743.1 hypothetical protein LDDCCGHA_5963 [Methylobacterium oxalidis]GLS62492.1 hypothetical protein GCM10007888_08730 [Methylobacterium oxalidis]